MTGKPSKFRLDTIYLRIAVPVSLLLFALSFTQHAFYIGSPDDSTYSSAFAFGLGWLGFMAGNFVTTFLWLANPLYILTLILSGFNKRISIMILSLLSLLLAISFLAVDTIATSESGNGPFFKIIIGNGYWLWLAAIAVLALGNILSYVNCKNIPPQ